MASMSATKKKQVSQNELRLLMLKQKLQTQRVKKKIESPLAKYSLSGQLSCAVCKLNIKDDSSWSVHISSKVHKDNISKRKPESSRMTERLAVTTESLKRTLPKQESFVPPKKLKGILKNYKAPPEKVPSDFFESPTPNSSENTNVNQETDEKMDVQPETLDDLNLDGGELPKGFFDDPMLDAKIRKEEYVSSIDEEFLKFQKEIKEENMLSEQIMADNEDETTYGRQVEEIDEQIKHWSKVIELEKKREKIALATENMNNMEIKNELDEIDESDGSDMDEFIDWRSKK
ncbi:zinc finger protein 830 [Acyrthosiphon pisum]|uniref:Zinc finger protein 830 n=1 Tax=Acyrthosiphon pisum TaxID=7029 RepID=A0A8R2A2D5_ACYPI|nr:zinc finger protein 830 [Acyrthosiphon pisum]|eukprot:XP_001948404.3 PREDICTED: zinc finger protein 830 [Acyrthosiphon pisum]